MDGPGGSYTAGNTQVADWRTLVFKSEAFIEENCGLAPGTADLIRRMPGSLGAFNNRFRLFIVHRESFRAPSLRGGRGEGRRMASDGR
ncbi:MAG TPA: hypothetical protein EYQ66_13460 [Myxococcales bacterium]|nr:hypothetical protein [Myxococcales bacterium]